MKRALFLAILLLALLTSCVPPDPRREADAYATRSQADQQAADAKQARQQKQETYNFDMQNKQATTKEWQSAVNEVISTAKIFVSFALSLAVIAAGIGAAWALVGSGRAAAHYMELRANLIPLDRVTRQYPLLLTYIGKGRYSLTNMNDDSVLLLDTRNEPDQRLIAAMGSTQYAGALAHEARMSLKPGEVSIITPPQLLEIEE